MARTTIAWNSLGVFVAIAIFFAGFRWVIYDTDVSCRNGGGWYE